MWSSACFLQNAGLLLPSTLKLGNVVQPSYKQRLTRIFTMPFSACCLQYFGVLPPTKLKLGNFAQGSYEHRLPTTFTMPCSACCLQYLPALLPSKLKPADTRQGWRWQRGIFLTGSDRSSSSSSGRENTAYVLWAELCAPAVRVTVNKHKSLRGFANEYT